MGTRDEERRALIDGMLEVRTAREVAAGLVALPVTELVWGISTTAPTMGQDRERKRGR